MAALAAVAAWGRSGQEGGGQSGRSRLFLASLSLAERGKLCLRVVVLQRGHAAFEEHW